MEALLFLAICVHFPDISLICMVLMFKLYLIFLHCLTIVIISISIATKVENLDRHIWKVET